MGQRMDIVVSTIPIMVCGQGCTIVVDVGVNIIQVFGTPISIEVIDVWE